MTELPASPAAESEHTHEAFELLGDRVPLTLLLDLAVTLESEEIYTAEPGSAEWLPEITD